jgi:hypothetical protein
MSALVVYRPRPEEAPVTIAVFCAEAETEKAALGAACVKRRKGGRERGGQSLSRSIRTGGGGFARRASTATSLFGGVEGSERETSVHRGGVEGRGVIARGVGALFDVGTALEAVRAIDASRAGRTRRRRRLS